MHSGKYFFSNNKIVYEEILLCIQVNMDFSNNKIFNEQTLQVLKKQFTMKLFEHQSEKCERIQKMLEREAINILDTLKSKQDGR